MMTSNPSKQVAERGDSGPSTITVRNAYWTSHSEVLTGQGILINSNISTYLTGSSLIALGLTWWQALICQFRTFSPVTSCWLNLMKLSLLETPWLHCLLSWTQYLEHITTLDSQSWIVMCGECMAANSWFGTESCCHSVCHCPQEAELI